jgi:hypothetical protein
MTGDSTVIYQNSSFNITDPANGTFFGFQNTNGGIGSVVFSTAVPGPFYNSRSPYIDNLSFGAVPEPSTIALMTVGLSAFVIIRRLRRA